MSKIAADAYSFPKGLQRRPVRSSLQIIKTQVAVDEIAYCLNPCPTGGGFLKCIPRKIEELAIHFAIADRQQERQWGDRQIIDFGLSDIRLGYVWLTAITNDCAILKADDPARRVHSTAMVLEIIEVVFDRQTGFDPKVFPFDQIGFARRMYAQHKNDRCRCKESQCNVISNLDQHESDFLRPKSAGQRSKMRAKSLAPINKARSSISNPEVCNGVASVPGRLTPKLTMQPGTRVK